jgi:hypothetical protein
MNYSAPRGWVYGSLSVPIGSNVGRLTVSLSRSSLNWIEQISSDTGETKSNVIAALLEYAKKSADNEYLQSMQYESEVLSNGLLSIPEIHESNRKYYADKYVQASPIEMNGQESLVEKAESNDNS